MLGAIIGDICASPWEGGSCSRGDFELFTTSAGLTDDTVCTIAIADAILEGKDYAACLREWVSRYPGRGYGGLFRNWAVTQQGPYNSYGNGGAMRVSPVALLARSFDEAESLAAATSAVTHNHPEGVKGAQAVASAIWMALNGARPTSIRSELARRYGYNLNPDVAQLERSGLGFSTLAEETVPAALICALEARTWQESIEHAVAVGGDSDTLACMAGGIAEALYGVPMGIAQRSQEYLPAQMLEVLSRLYSRAGRALPWQEETAQPVHESVSLEGASTPVESGASWWTRLFRR
jgi:ADP-ribosyl-[dinitrogen reductase] hydrolase